MASGTKDGWSLEQGGWVTNSVGFAGAGQRYTLAIMNALGGDGGYDDGGYDDDRAEPVATGRSRIALFAGSCPQLRVHPRLPRRWPHLGMD